MRKYKLGYVDDGAVFYDFIEQHVDIFEFIYFCPRNHQSIDDLYLEIREKDLDILVIDYRLNEYALIDFKGTNLIEYVRSRRKDFPCILLTSHPDEAIDDFSDAHLVYHKSMIVQSDAQIDGKISTQNIFMKIIISSIEKYIREIESASERIFELNKKNNLSLEEEQEYIIYDEFIENNTDGLHSVPRKLKHRTYSDQIDTLIQETSVLLEKLREYDVSNKE